MTAKRSFFAVVIAILTLTTLGSSEKKPTKEVTGNFPEQFRHFNVGVLMASRLDSPFDLERCGPAVDLALEEVNLKFLKQHQIRLRKVQRRYICPQTPCRNSMQISELRDLLKKKKHAKNRKMYGEKCHFSSTDCGENFTVFGE